METIGSYAFENCSELESVSLPNTLSSMGEAAFRKTALKELTIPGSLKTIPIYAFSGCAELEKLVIESGVEVIASGNTSYNTGAFQNCTKLRSVEIRGNTLEQIGARTFCGCTKLNSINIPSSVETISAYAFYNCTSLTSIVLPGVETIGNYAFENCSELESVSLPNTLSSMGEAAFRKTALKELTIPGSLKTIPIYAFSGCAELEKLVIESGVEVIASGNTSYNTGAFQNCTALKEVTIKGDTLESIGVKTFSGCTDLRNVYLPASVETIGSNAFYNCKNAIVWVYANTPAHSYCTNNSAAQGFAYKLYGSEPTPTPVPTATPTPTVKPTATPTIKPTVTPTVKPTTTPTAKPTATPTPVPDGELILSGESELTVGKSMTITVMDENGKTISARSLEWSSSDRSIATVSRGKVTARKGGVVTITAENDDGLTGYLDITVVPKASSVTIWYDGEEAGNSLGVDISDTDEVQLEAVVNPENAAQGVTWKSGSTKVAKVNENGLVTFLKAGKVTITATTADGSRKSDKITINAGIMAQEIEITGAEEIAAGKNITLKAKVYPEKASQSVAWSSSDKSVATVSSSGKVTAKRVKGVESAIITATAKDGSGVSAEFEIWVVPAATSVTITIDGENAGSSAILDIGGGDPSLQLDAIINPEDASQAVTWKSSSTKVATVNESGLVTGLKTGKATITATAADGSRKSDKITINVICAAQEIEITGAEELTAGKNITLKAKVYPEESDSSVSWKSSNTSVATVDSKGKVTAKKVSSAESVIITATAKDGSGVSAEYELWVYPAATKVEILMDGISASAGTLSLADTDGTQLEAVVYPEDASQSVSWKSSNTRVATIDENGYVTANRAGKATITATTANGRSTRFSLTVQEESPAEEALPLLLADVEIGSTNTAKTPDVKLPSGVPKITVSATSSRIIVKHEDASKAFNYSIDTYSHFDGELAALDMGNGEYTFLLMVDETSNFYPGGWYVVFRLNGSKWETLKEFDSEKRPDDIHVYASFIDSSRFAGEIFPTRTAFTGTMKQSSTSYIGKDLWEGGFSMSYEEAKNGCYNIIFSTYEYPSMNDYNGGGSKTRYVMQGDKLVISSQWYEIPDYVGSLDEAKWIGSQPPTETMLVQQSSTSCTAASIAMMLRSYAAQNGLDYSAVTEAYVKSICWLDGIGVMWGKEYNVGGKTISMTNVDLNNSMDKKQKLIELLTEQPSGIVIYDRDLPHALLLCGYDPITDTFYCVDPLDNSSTAKRIIPLAESRNAVGGNGRGSQQGVIDHITRTGVITKVS